MPAKPQIVIPDAGVHNRNLEQTRARLGRSGAYRDNATILICPSRGVVPCKVIASWLGLIRPMNTRTLGPLFPTRMEVGVAYSETVEMILAHPDLKTYKYILTIEEDNILPPDALLRLHESIDARELGGPYDAVGGLYFTKGELGEPMCYGNPAVMPKNFIPFLPAPDQVVRCNGLGMGCTLFRLAMLRDPALCRPLFKSQQDVIPGQGARCMSQDLYFFEHAGRMGYKFACDARVKVGHYDYENDTVW